MRRKFGLLLVCGAVLPLMFAAGAHAQGAVMLVSPKVATPGQLVNVTGSGFGTAGDVNLRLNTRDGVPVGGTVTDTSGRISTTIAAPATPGEYLLIGTQTTPNGRQRAFTPGRTRLRVVAAAAKGAAGAAPSDGFAPAIPSAAGLGLLLLAGGLMFTVRRQRALRRPAVAPDAASSR